jgi:hypothetical protein
MYRQDVGTNDGDKIHPTTIHYGRLDIQRNPNNVDKILEVLTKTHEVSNG